MAFIETPIFPSCPSFGYTATPQYSVSAIQTVGGFERRVRHWARPLYVYTVTIGPRYETEIEELLEFWHAMGGIECGFRFKDYADCKSCGVSGTPTATDQSASISEGTYFLTKQYTAGARTQVRRILKPVSGTILLADNGVAKTEGVDWSVDYTTGQLTLNFTPAGVITWGGEFDVPARFDSEFPVEIIEHKIESVSFQVRELRSPEA